MSGSATIQVSQPSLAPLTAFQAPVVPDGSHAQIVVLGRARVARVDEEGVR